MQARRAGHLARIQRTLGRVEHAENLRRGDDRTDGFSERADLRDFGRLGGCGRPRSVTFGCSYPCRHCSSRPSLCPYELSVDCHYDNMLQAAPGQLNQKHLSSMEDVAQRRLMPTTAEPTEAVS
jgi:hypothetical protein